ncbi:MAG: metallopeptidase family protein [Asticcacaulis sp.]
MSEALSLIGDLKAPDLDTFAALAEAALTALPEPFCGFLTGVRCHVFEFADEDTLSTLGLDDPFELTGLYEGPSLAEQSLLDPLPSAPRISLYRRPILDEWADRGDVSLSELITHVVVHEVAHHFGLSDDDIDRIEDSVPD